MNMKNANNVIRRNFLFCDCLHYVDCCVYTVIHFSLSLSLSLSLLKLTQALKEKPLENHTSKFDYNLTRSLDALF